MKAFLSVFILMFFVTCPFLFTSKKALANITIVPYSDSDTKSEEYKKYESGDYEINDFVEIGVNVTKFILGIVGSLALLFFVYGGFMFLISEGSSDKVQKAKSIIVNSVIGILIVFLSWIIIDFTLRGLGYRTSNLQESKIEGPWSGTIFKR